MRIATVFGTRPEIIRLSRVIAELDAFCEQVLIDTGQNYNSSLSDVFFDELGVRTPDVHLGVRPVRVALTTHSGTGFHQTAISSDTARTVAKIILGHTSLRSHGDPL